MDLALLDTEDGADGHQAGCNRCGNPLPPDGEAIATPCGHLFCLPCATASFDPATQRGSCALCQQPLHAKDARRVRPQQPAGNLKVGFVFLSFVFSRGRVDDGGAAPPRPVPRPAPTPAQTLSQPPSPRPRV